jgi:hypothetical protein
VTGYVILCGCGIPQRWPVFHGPVDGRHVVALIDDARPDGPLRVEQNPPEDSSTAVKPNRLGDRRSSFNLRCAGCDVNLSPIRLSRVGAVLDRIVGEPDQLIAAIKKLGWTMAIDFHDEDVPATQADYELQRKQFEAEIGFTEPYDGPTPKLVPRYSQRWVIPWLLFTACASRLPKRRRQ